MGYQFNEDGHLGGNIKRGDPACHCPKVWDYLIDRFALRSMMDLGCGEGHAAHYFFKRGVAALAVDGSCVNLVRQVFPILIHDIEVMPVQCAVDLVWCQEVVEHVEEKYLWNLTASLACGDIVVMTHADPGQGGYHHVNCQPADYWIGKMSEVGYEHLTIDTERVRMLAAMDSAHHAHRSALVFGRKT